MAITDQNIVELRRARLREWIDIHHGGVAADFIKVSGINQGELSGLLKSKSFGEKRAMSLEKAAGMPAGYLSAKELPEGRPMPNPVSPLETRSDYIRVEQLDIEAKMGHGRVNQDVPEVVRSVDFTPAFIRSLVGFVPDLGRLKLITAVGDSMAPKIRPGEVVLVDTACSEFMGDGLYVITSAGGLQIKALQAQGNHIYVMSMDHVLYPPYEADDSIQIKGRVYLVQHFERVA